MKSKTIEPGDIVIVDLPSHTPKGHEQEGYRPVIVVGVPKGDVKYPLVIACPLTTSGFAWIEKNPNLYKLIPKGSGGVNKDSIVLIDQIRAIDAYRVRSYIGSLDKERYSLILSCLIKIFK